MPKVSYLLLSIALAFFSACNQEGSGQKKDSSTNKKAKLKTCRCPKILRPVCGDNNRTYGNSCLAECDHVDKWQDGSCKKKKIQQDKVKKEGCICSMEFNPVCGEDGRTYSNPCRAECHNIQYIPGECKN